MKKDLLFNFSKSLGLRTPFRIAASAALILLSAQSSFGQTTYTWGGASNDFNTNTNWSPTTASFNSTNENFTITSTVFNPVVTSGAVTCRIITVNVGTTLEIGHNFTSTTNTSNINGTLNINAGTDNIPKLYINTTGGSTSVVNIGAGATVSANNLWKVGNNATGTGTLNINGGTLTLTGSGNATGTTGANGLKIGDTDSCTGTLNINSGTVNINYTSFTGGFVIFANGSIVIDNGSMVIPGDVTGTISGFGNKIKAVAGKVISNTFDGTNTIVKAIPDPALGINDVSLDSNAIVVYSENQSIKIQSGSGTLSDVKVYNLQGRLVANKSGIGLNETSVSFNKSNQMYIVKVTSTNGAVVAKKIIH